ncbi:MAG TPA: hypothetical protein VGK13_01605 [Methanocellaceae archaeon]
MIRDIAVTTVISQPLFAWLGLLTILSLLATATIGYGMIKGWTRNIKLHKYVAATTIVIGLVHATLALSTLFSF